MSDSIELTTYKLGQLLSVKHGWAFKGEFFEGIGEQCILTPGNFYEKGGFKPNTGKERYYSGNYPEEYLCKKGDLIVAMTQQAEGLLGSTAIVPEDNKYLHNQRIGLIMCNEQNLNRLFAYYLFMTKSVREQLERSSSGTKVKHTSPERIYDVEVKIPDVVNQRKIASFLLSIENKIKSNELINDNLQQQLCLIYEHMMCQFQKEKVKGRTMAASELTEIITGKEDANFSVANGKYKFFTCSNNTLQCDDYAFESSSVLIAGNGDFNVKHYSGKFNAYQRTYVLTPAKEYFGILYLASLYQIKAFKSASTGSIVKFITKGDIESIPVFLPNDNTYMKQMNHLIALQEQNSLENEELTKLRDWLLPILMNGQANISD